nr:MAG TPA: hypothetical protein [Caudoviricetes sp.]
MIFLVTRHHITFKRLARVCKLKEVMLCTTTSYYLTLTSASRIKSKWRVKAIQDYLYHTKYYILFSCFR